MTTGGVEGMFAHCKTFIAVGKSAAKFLPTNGGFRPILPLMS